MKQAVFLLTTLVAVLLLPYSSYATDEEITLTTYYPAPYGDYDSLSIGDGYSGQAADKNLVVEGDVGIGNTTPGTALDVTGALTLRSTSAPATAPANQGRIYYDSTSNDIMFSSNTGAYRSIGGGGGIDKIWRYYCKGR